MNKISLKSESSETGSKSGSNFVRLALSTIGSHFCGNEKILIKLIIETYYDINSGMKYNWNLVNND